MLNERSNPFSSTYGQWLSIDEIANIIGITSHEQQQLENALLQNNIKDIKLSRSRDMIHAHVPIHMIRQILHETHLLQNSHILKKYIHFTVKQKQNNIQQ